MFCYSNKLWIHAMEMKSCYWLMIYLVRHFFLSIFAEISKYEGQPQSLC